MVYGVARQSGGTARIESEVGKGTSVKLYFRHAEGGGPQAEADEAKAEAKATSKKKASVLIIDDDPDVREFIASSLSEAGFAVREAADGESGLEKFEKQPADLVVMDFVMPGLSGAEVANRMLAVRPGQPILFVSGFSETESIRRLAPDKPLLSKPFRADALEAAVRAALAKN
jgi:CheY-like chemotaxis protein